MDSEEYKDREHQKRLLEKVWIKKEQLDRLKKEKKQGHQPKIFTNMSAYNERKFHNRKNSLDENEKETQE